MSIFERFLHKQGFTYLAKMAGIMATCVSSSHRIQSGTMNITGLDVRNMAKERATGATYRAIGLPYKIPGSRVRDLIGAIGVKSKDTEAGKGLCISLKMKLPVPLKSGLALTLKRESSNCRVRIHLS